MNMNRMLNAFILIFFMVNIALYGYINHWKDVEYVISAEEMTLFKEIMDKNNVILYTTLPEFRPRPPLIHPSRRCA